MANNQPATQQDIDDVIDSYESQIKDLRDEFQGEISQLAQRIDDLERSIDGISN